MKMLSSIMVYYGNRTQAYIRNNIFYHSIEQNICLSHVLSFSHILLFFGRNRKSARRIQCIETLLKRTFIQNHYFYFYFSYLNIQEDVMLQIDKTFNISFKEIQWHCEPTCGNIRWNVHFLFLISTKRMWFEYILCCQRKISTQNI